MERSICNIPISGSPPIPMCDWTSSLSHSAMCQQSLHEFLIEVNSFISAAKESIYSRDSTKYEMIISRANETQWAAIMGSY